ncbi:TetR/AcrR family transcriptional regulator [Amycolatopsis sp. EV170708-02-1]|uniref:TetR/AcrR family transcriptional regulator n=1 Tax=Amycolatopsis sp. EV170708-02-1 TaxID=2919322 RepID=UPI001F0CDB5F|nr:TetR/AcrR family transcriptional regulator [Amycolatopsis sp. EV170708-02-1]UMP01723.1 TetR/AcrR family transcriptional regulator [Amycolatopsis sp. EV170708-02-1]
MARPRQFDETTAIEAAAAVFRQRGYNATSIDHLVEATGVHRGSLYGAFGSKHGLFARVLDHVADDRDDAGRLDILLIALLELAPEDERVRARARAVMQDLGTTPDQLGRRLLARAGLPDIDNGGTT